MPSRTFTSCLQLMGSDRLILVAILSIIARYKQEWTWLILKTFLDLSKLHICLNLQPHMLMLPRFPAHRSCPTRQRVQIYSTYNYPFQLLPAENHLCSCLWLWDWPTPRTWWWIRKTFLEQLAWRVYTTCHCKFRILLDSYLHLHLHDNHHLHIHFH